jgi:hypothetical protein
VLQERNGLKSDRHGNIENSKETELFSISDLSSSLVTSSAAKKNHMISPTQQLQLSSKTEKRPSIRQLSAQLSRNRCISWSLNVSLAVTAIVLLLVASLDVVQAAFCVHLFGFCITCAVLVWTKDSRNIFGASVGFPVAHFVVLLFIIWDCEPLFLLLKLVVISCGWFGTRIMRILGVRLVHALENKPKSRVQQVTIVQLLIGAALVLVASLHLAYPDHEAISIAEMALWSCFLVDVLWHFGIWKKTMKRIFGGVKGMRKILSGQNANLKMIEGVRRRQNIIATVGILFTEATACALMIFANPVLDLLLQDKSDECKQRHSVGSHRISAFGFPAVLAFHITVWVAIYSHVMKERRDEQLRRTSEESRQVLQVSSLISISD